MYDNIVKVYITFLSMETKDLVQEQLLRSDAKLPKQLRSLYESRGIKPDPKSVFDAFSTKKEDKPDQ